MDIKTIAMASSHIINELLMDSSDSDDDLGIHYYLSQIKEATQQVVDKGPEYFDAIDNYTDEQVNFFFSTKYS